MRYKKYVDSMEMEDVKVRESRSYNGDIIILLFFTFVVVFAIIRLFLGIFKEDVSVVENCTLGIQNNIKIPHMHGRRWRKQY